MNNNRPALPFQITLGRPNWRFRIQQGHNQPVLLSQWLQGGQQSQQQGDGLVSPNLEMQSPADIALDMTVDYGNDVMTGRNQEDQADASTPPPSPPTNYTVPPSSPPSQTSTLSAINMFLEQNPEVYSLLQTLLTYIPFVALVLFKEIYKHSSDILVVAALVVAFIHANNTVQREVSKQVKRELGPLIVIILNILACLTFVYVMCGDEQLYHTLLFFPPGSEPLTFSNLMWAVTITDHILKLATVLLKAIAIALPISMFPIARRGKCFVFVERSSHLYRALAAVPPWINYLLISSNSNEMSSFFFYDSLIGICLCAVYLTCKAYKSVKIVRIWKTAFDGLSQSNIYGTFPSSEQLQAAGPMCPICHDNYKRPTYLECKHVFCEDCLAMWLDRERTCPMCRSTVADDPEWKDGSTSYLVQLF